MHKNTNITMYVTMYMYVYIRICIYICMYECCMNVASIYIYICMHMSVSIEESYVHNIAVILLSKAESNFDAGSSPTSHPQA